MKTYRSKIGWEIWVPTAIILAFVGTRVMQSWEALSIILLTTFFIIMVVTQTKYVITDVGTLIVRCWILIRVEIDIQSIHRIRKTYNPVSSPAAAIIGRIEVFYDNGKSVIISPADKPAFISDLLSRNKRILAAEA